MKNTELGSFVDVENAVLATLKSDCVSLRATHLVKRVKERGIDNEATIKAAIWQLVADKRLQLTPDRRLRIPYGK